MYNGAYMIKIDIVKRYEKLSSYEMYDKEINLVRFERDRAPMLEIRDWHEDKKYDECGYGIRFTRGEVQEVIIKLKNIYSTLEEKEEQLRFLHQKYPIPNNIDPYKDQKYNLNIYEIKDLCKLSIEKNIEKVVKLIFWDDFLPWIPQKKLFGYKIDIRYWPLYLDISHRGITLDNNYEIKRTIEVFENYLDEYT